MKNENGLRALKIVRDRLIEMFLISVLLWTKTSTQCIQCQPAIRRSFCSQKIGGAQGGRKRGLKKTKKQRI